MAFPRRQLRDGEEIVLDLRPHPIAIAFNVTVIVLTVVAAILILVNIHGSSSVRGWLRWIVNIAALLVILFFAVPGIVGWLTEHFVVTTERVISRSGWISKDQKDIPLDRIQNVAFKQTVFERMIGAGDVTLESAGEESDTRFKDVRHPESVQKTIYEAREQDEQRGRQPQSPTAQPPRPEAVHAPEPAAAPTPAPATSAAAVPVADELAKLASLRDQGVISETEFQAQKARLLGA